MSNLSSKEKLAAARLLVVRKAPYMTAAVTGMIPREAPGLGTLAVTERALLLWDAEFVNKCSVEETMWVLVHEANHLIRDHLARGKALAADHTLFNIAGDLEINDDLERMGAKLPGGGITPKTFELEEGLIAETYYGQLRQKAKDAGGDIGQEGEGKPCPGGGWCGSGAGRPVPEEEKHGGGSGTSKKQDKLGKGSVDGRSEADLQRIRQQVAEGVRNHVKQHGQGSVPNGLQVWADSVLAPPKIPWAKKLARSVRSAVNFVAGSVDYSYARTSRRQGAVGFGLRKPVLPTLRAPVPKVAVGVDTSGSMLGGEMERAAAEVAGILKATGSAVDFVACDCQVHTATKLKHPREFSRLFKGGGGTSFVPAFEALEQFKPDVAVFVTDGCGDAPAVQPKGIAKVIWVLVGRHRTRPYSPGGGNVGWGEFIEVED